MNALHFALTVLGFPRAATGGGGQGTASHLEDGLGPEPLGQEEQDLSIKAAATVHIPHYSWEHLLGDTC